MKQKRHSVEEIIRILREADSSKNVEAVCREHNITATSYYRWKKKFGGMDRGGSILCSCAMVWSACNLRWTCDGVTV
jgi:transposase-like protein